MTKTEIARLVRVARDVGHYSTSPTTKEFSCPLDMEAKRRDHDRTLAHRFTVHHLPWEKGTSAAEVTKALISHIDPDMEECAHVAR